MADLLAGLSIVFPALILAVTVHEAAHAATAALFGDKAALACGRVSINPLRHCSMLGYRSGADFDFRPDFNGSVALDPGGMGQGRADQ